MNGVLFSTPEQKPQQKFKQNYVVIINKFHGILDLNFCFNIFVKTDSFLYKFFSYTVLVCELHPMLYSIVTLTH